MCVGGGGEGKGKKSWGRCWGLGLGRKVGRWVVVRSGPGGGGLAWCGCGIGIGIGITIEKERMSKVSRNATPDILSSRA